MDTPILYAYSNNMRIFRVLSFFVCSILFLIFSIIFINIKELLCKSNILTVMFVSCGISCLWTSLKIYSNKNQGIFIFSEHVEFFNGIGQVIKIPIARINKFYFDGDNCIIITYHKLFGTFDVVIDRYCFNSTSDAKKFAKSANHIIRR